MSDISLVVDYINTQLTNSTGLFKGKPFQKGLFNGLCKQIDRENGDAIEKQIIKFDDAKGINSTGIYLDDKYPFQIYHRVKSMSINDESVSDFYGDDGEQKIVTFEVALIGFVDKFNVQINMEEVVTGLAVNLPNEIKPSSITSSQFSKCEIKSTDVVIDTNDVFSQEYGEDKSVPQNFYIFEYVYEVSLNYNKNCYTLC
jgi:hypothetical protein